jgi:hypothetical protein
VRGCAKGDFGVGQEIISKMGDLLRYSAFGAVLGSWFLVLGSWFLVLGSWFLVLGSWFLVLGSWFFALQRICKN